MYNSFSTTKYKLPKTFDNLIDLSNQAVNLSQINITYRSNNWKKENSIIKVLSGYEVDNFVPDTNTIQDNFNIQLNLIGVDESSLPSINLFPIIYPISYSPIGGPLGLQNYGNNYRVARHEKTFQKIGDNIIIFIYMLSSFSDANFNDIPTFMDLYVVFQSRNLYYAI